MESEKDAPVVVAGREAAPERKDVGFLETMSSIWYFASGSDKWLMILGITLSFLNGCAMPIFMQIFGGLMNSLGAPEATDRGVNYYVKIQLYIGVASFFVSGVGTALLEYTAEKQLKLARREYMAAVLRQEMGWFDRFDGGTLASRLNQNCIEIRDGIGLKTGQLFQFGAMFIGGYVSGFVRHVKMAAVLTAVTPVLAASGYFMIRVMSGATKKSQKTYNKAGSVAEEVLGSVRTVAAFGAERASCSRYDALLGAVMREGVKGGVAAGVGMGITMAVIFLSFALGFWYGARIIVESARGGCVGDDCFMGGDALTVFFSIVIGAFALGQAGPNFSAVMRAGTAVVDMRELIERQSEIDPTSPAGLRDVSLKGDIVFRNVTFAYPTRPDRHVYKNLNLHIPAGKTVALVGGSGCGKSTATQLIQRFYDINNDEGSITIDGFDVREFNIEWLRNQMSLVSQEPRLFARSIAANISDGRLDATREEIEKAAASANAMGFINKFPEGLDTFVGDAGSQLSGGQKQRIAIARAMLRNPAVLILDEATSALDNESEKVVQLTLDKLVAKRRRTTIVIAHRLSTVRSADKIIVLSNPTGAGAVVAEEGSHDELMKFENGIYRNMVLAQGLETDLHHKRQLSREATNVSIEQNLASETPLGLSRSMTATRRESRSHISSLLKKASSLVSGDQVGGKDAAGDGPPQGGEVVSGGSKAGTTESMSFMRIFKMLAPFHKEVTLGVLGSIVAGCVFPLYTLLLGRFMNVYFYTPIDDMESRAGRNALWFLGLSAMSLVGISAQRTFMEMAGHQLARHLRSKAFEQMLYQNMAFFDFPENSPGSLSEILAADVLLVKGMSGDNLAVYIQNIATLIAALIIAFTANAKLAAVSLASFLAIMPAAFIQMQFETGRGKDVEGDAKSAGHVINEAVMNIRVITAYNLQGRMMDVYEVVLASDLQAGTKATLIGGFFLGLANFLQFAAQAVPLWYGGVLLGNGEISNVGDMTTATMALMMAAMGVGQSSVFATDLKKAKVAAARVFRVLDRVPEIDSRDPTGYPLVADAISGKINVNNIHFKYPSRPETMIFRKLLFEIPPGDTVALVGASGCGKSTIIQLLERFYDVGEAVVDGQNTRDGSLKLDDRDVRDVNLKSLRSLFGLVGQEPILFDTTICENIRYGKPDATMEEIEEAAKMANAHNFITQFTDGYNTLVGKAASQLSGGQKQRIAIARAIIRDPKILLLDEATSALDSESEQQVQAALDDLMRRTRRTTITIAHRLSTVRNSDCIIVLANPDNEGSEVVESGTHEELMRIEGGVYHGLVKIALAAGEK